MERLYVVPLLIAILAMLTPPVSALQFGVGDGLAIVLFVILGIIGVCALLGYIARRRANSWTGTAFEHTYVQLPYWCNVYWLGEFYYVSTLLERVYSYIVVYRLLHCLLCSHCENLMLFFGTLWLRASAFGYPIIGWSLQYTLVLRVTICDHPKADSVTVHGRNLWYTE